MPHASLTLTVPDGVWVGDVSRAHPESSLRILAALTDDGLGVALAEVTAADLEGVVRDIVERDAVTELEVLQRHGDTALIQFETTTPLLLLAVQGSGVPLTMPFTIRDGQADWELTAPHDRLSELGDQLDAMGISFTVREVRQRAEPEQLLTDRQLTLVRTAVERGYYDSPRGCSLTELAAEVDLAKSTVSETLHRAEERIVKQFLEQVEAGHASTFDD